MSKNRMTRMLALLMALALVFGMIPGTLATDTRAAFVSETHDVFSRTTTTIAPGVTQDICYAYAKDGKQMVYYVATADVTRDDVVVQTSYLNQHENGVLGMEKLTNQMAFAAQKYTNAEDPLFISEYYTPVAGVNASFYNMTTGQPMGITYIDGVSFGTSSYDNFFAILKDGKTAVIDYAANLSSYVDEEGNSTIWQAVAGSQWLVRDGADVTAGVSGSYNTDRHSRCCVGVTAEGKVVTMVLDGRQEPFSCGGSMHELAQIMLEAGCVAAINLDGGGSATYAARQAGSDSVTVVNRPSDGSERSISAGMIIASTAAPSDVFATAVLTAESNYVTPGSTVHVSAVGVSPAGTSAEIPESVIWQLADDAMGTVENGVFVSNGTTGDAVVQMVYEGSVVGEATIHVVVPDAISFSNETFTVPYGKTVVFELVATYGIHHVTTREEDFVLALENDAIGTLSGLSFMAAGEGTAVTSAAVTAALAADPTVTATAQIVLGKGSEVVVDFEDGTDNGFELDDYNFGYYLPNHETTVVTPETGKVHSGDYALALRMDYSNSLESGYQRIRLKYSGEDLVGVGALRLGMWIYIPDEFVGLWGRWSISSMTGVSDSGEISYGAVITAQDYDGANGATGVVYSFNESGWHYVSIDTASYAGAAIRGNQYCFQFYVSDRDGASFDYYFKDQHNVNGDFTIYIDDITFDYSSVVEDREAPVFGSVSYATPIMSDAVTLNDGTVINSSSIDFAATVADNTTKDSYTGIDASTAKAYVDGNEVPATYANGRISMDSTAAFTAGKHIVKFSICDKQGNYASVIRTFTVAADAVQPIRLVAHDPTADRILLGSIQYVDVVAADAANVQSVTLTLDLDNMSDWQLDHMIVAEGFEAVSSLRKDENIATLTITRTGENTQTGEAVLVSIPVRAWFLENEVQEKPTTTNPHWTLYDFTKSSQEFWPIAIDVQVDQGFVTYTDGASDTFTGEGVFIWTEMWANYANMTATDEGKAYYASWNGGHTHTAQAVDDCAATCTETGYTGRTFCEGCNSVVDWGTTVPAAGHTYDFVDGVLQCVSCALTFSGQWTDGKLYTDGVAVSASWIGDSYYVNGVKLTGVQKVEDYYYDFGEDGVCADRQKYTGLFFDEADQVYRYAKLGVLDSGWFFIDDDWYYFAPATMAAVSGRYKVSGVYFDFEDNGKLVSGVWVDAFHGYKYYYGPSYYNNGWKEIDGKEYFFRNGYRLTGVNQATLRSVVQTKIWCVFDENGVFLHNADGIVEYEGNYYYVEDGFGVEKYLVEVDGEYYYATYGGKLAVNKTVNTIGTSCDLPKGIYSFGADGKMIGSRAEGQIVTIDGVLYYYESGKGVEKGLVCVDGAYYYAAYQGKLVTDKVLNVQMNTTDLPNGRYEFGADGKLVNGILDKDGVLYYYENGQGVEKGLICVDGAYYYAAYQGKLVTDKVLNVQTNTTDLPNGQYEFGTDGRMLDGIVEKNGVLYYYETGKGVEKGLVRVGDDYYYAAYQGKLVTDRTLNVQLNSSDLPNGRYEFGVDGRMVNGIVEKDGALYYYENGQATEKGLVRVGDDYYYAAYKGKLVTDRILNVQLNSSDLPNGRYEFGADGKMLNGIVDKDGVLYYYENGQALEKGLICVDGAYYFAAYQGKLAVSKEINAWQTNCDLPTGRYEFGADGKMLDGIVEKDGALYYYENGQGLEKGLVHVDGAYYYAAYKGKLVTGKTIYAGISNCDLPTGRYEFGADGKMLDGIVEKDGRLYYYENGVGVEKGLFYLDGYYYYSVYKGELVTNRSLYIRNGNGLLLETTYTFNEYGQIVG